MGAVSGKLLTTHYGRVRATHDLLLTRAACVPRARSVIRICSVRSSPMPDCRAAGSMRPWVRRATTTMVPAACRVSGGRVKGRWTLACQEGGSRDGGCGCYGALRGTRFGLCACTRACVPGARRGRLALRRRRCGAVRSSVAQRARPASPAHSPRPPGGYVHVVWAGGVCM